MDIDCLYFIVELVIAIVIDIDFFGANVLAF
jgi:hypothetical protein